MEDATNKTTSELVEVTPPRVPVGPSLEEKVMIARGQVFAHLLFFGHLLSKAEVVLIDRDTEGFNPFYKGGCGLERIKAAVTPDGTIYFNRGECDYHPAPRITATLIHEIMHPALDCWARGKGRDVIIQCKDPATGAVSRFSLWNLSHDLSFNLDIAALKGGRVDVDPSELAVDTRFGNKSAEEIYDILLAEIPPAPPDDIYDMGMFPAGLRGLFEEALDDVLEGAGGLFDGTDEEAELSRRKWRQHIVEAAQIAEQSTRGGGVPAGIAAYVKRLRESRVPWGTALERWAGPYGAKSVPTYSRRYRKQASYPDVIMPGMTTTGFAEFVVFWDTSGSMGGREELILSEIAAICKTLGVGLRILCIDNYIEADYRDVKSAEDFLGSKPERPIMGGGGSDFRCGFALLAAEDYQGPVIAITDGHIHVPRAQPENLAGVLWVIGIGKYSEHDVYPAPWGDRLRIDMNDLSSVREDIDPVQPSSGGSNDDDDGGAF